MNIVRKIVLYLLLLIVMAIGGTIVIKVYDLILKLGFENIWVSGFQAGFAAWIGWLVCDFHRYKKDKKQKQINN